MSDRDTLCGGNKSGTLMVYFWQSTMMRLDGWLDERRIYSYLARLAHERIYHSQSKFGYLRK